MNGIALIILILAIFWLALEHGSLCIYTVNLKRDFEDYQKNTNTIIDELLKHTREDFNKIIAIERKLKNE